MNPYQKVIIIVSAPLFLLACQNNNHSTKEQQPLADSITSPNYVSSSAAVENGKDSTRRFIRTADLKFKVKDVVQATYDIEDIIRSHNGFVTHANLTSEINDRVTTAISKDSLLETTHYTVTNTVTLRIPNTQLDTTLKDIAKHIGYLDHRIITAEDVALRMLANKLTESRNNVSKERLTNAVETKANKLDETTTAEDAVLNKAEQADNAKLSNLSLNDQVKYSTVSLYIYQRPAIKQEVIPDNDKTVKVYEPSFGSRLLEAMKGGWSAFESLLIGLSSLWPVMVLGLGGYLVYRRYRVRKVVSSKS